MATNPRNKKIARRSETAKPQTKHKASAQSEHVKKGTGYARTELEKADEERAGQ